MSDTILHGILDELRLLRHDLTSEKYRLIDGHLCRVLPGVPPELKPEPTVTITRTQLFDAMTAWMRENGPNPMELGKLARKLGLEP